MYGMLKEVMINRKKDKKSRPEVGPVKDGMDRFEWHGQFKILLDSIPSIGVDQGILYVICKDRGADYNPARIKNLKEHMMYQVASEKPDFNHDNRCV